MTGHLTGVKTIAWECDRAVFSAQQGIFGVTSTLIVAKLWGFLHLTGLARRPRRWSRIWLDRLKMTGHMLSNKREFLMVMNRRILLKRRPKGMPTLEDFEFAEAPMPDPGPGEVLVRNRFLSLDPYMRGLMDAGKSYLTPLELGQVMDGATIADVVASNDAGFAAGDTVWAPGRWQDYAVCKPPPARPPLRKVDTKLAPPTTWLGPMGLPGWTAYVGLLDLGEPRSG